MKRYSKPILALIVCSVFLQGCTGFVDKQYRETSKTEDAQDARIHKEIEKDRSSMLPYVGNRVITRKRDNENALPESMNSVVTIGDSSPMTLSQIGQRLTEITRIPVNIAPELITNPAGGQGSGMPGMPPGMGMPPTPATPAPSAPGSVAAIYLPRISISFNGSTSEFLDMISSRLGITWEYADGSINFARYITRVYTLNIFPGSSNQSASVGKTGSTSSGGMAGGATGAPGAGTTQGPSGGGAFSSSSTSDFTSSLDAWSTIDAQIKAMVSIGGKYSVASATGVIVVTDTKEAQSRIARYIKKIDRLMNQQVTLKVSVMSVDTSNNSGAGINWTAVWTKLSQLSPNYSATFAGIPMPAAVAGGGSAGLTFTAPLNAAAAGHWTGSGLMFEALAAESNATMVSDNTLITLNKQPTSVAIATQTGYVQSTNNIVGSIGQPAVTSVNVATLTTGFILNMTPSIMDGNEVALQFSLDISTPPTMVTMSGVQIPSFSGTQIAQRAKIREGETLVLSGFSLKNLGTNQQGTFSPGSMAAGGNRSSSQQNQYLVILITPIME